MSPTIILKPRGHLAIHKNLDTVHSLLTNLSNFFTLLTPLKPYSTAL